MTIEADNLLELLFGKFQYLVKKYGFVVDEKIYDVNEVGIIFKNDTLAISVIYEYRSAYLNITLHRLVGGVIENDKYPFRYGVSLNNVGMDFIVKYKDESRLARSLYDAKCEFKNKESSLEDIASLQSANLEEFCGEVLNGDFSLFAEVDNYIKKYYREKGVQVLD